jgi:hypothetical protein
LSESKTAVAVDIQDLHLLSARFASAHQVEINIASDGIKRAQFCSDAKLRSPRFGSWLSGNGGAEKNCVPGRLLATETAVLMRGSSA